MKWVPAKLDKGSFQNEMGSVKFGRWSFQIETGACQARQGSFWNEMGPVKFDRGSFQIEMSSEKRARTVASVILTWI